MTYRTPLVGGAQRLLTLIMLTSLLLLSNTFCPSTHPQNSLYFYPNSEAVQSYFFLLTVFLESGFCWCSVGNLSPFFISQNQPWPI